MNECDYCGQPLHRDHIGYWVGEDGTSDCPDSPHGHEIDGAPR